MYKSLLEKYLSRLYKMAPSPGPFCFSFEAAEWLEDVLKIRDGESYVPINKEAVDLWWEWNERGKVFVSRNLYTFLLVEGINVPYWEFVDEEEYRCEEQGMVYMKGGWKITTADYDLTLAC